MEGRTIWAASMEDMVVGLVWFDLVWFESRQGVDRI